MTTNVLPRFYESQCYGVCARKENKHNLFVRSTPHFSSQLNCTLQRVKLSAEITLQYNTRLLPWTVSERRLRLSTASDKTQHMLHRDN